MMEKKKIPVTTISRVNLKYIYNLYEENTETLMKHLALDFLKISYTKSQEGDYSAQGDSGLSRVFMLIS